jgi:hypothetical protein
MAKKIIKKQLFIIIISIVILSVLLDGLNRWLNFEIGLSEKLNFSIYFRLLLLIFSFIISGVYNRWFATLSTLFLGVVMLGSFTVSEYFHIDLMMQIKFASKFIYPVSVYLCLKHYTEQVSDWSKLFRIILFWLFISQAIISIIGLLFNITFLRSYSGSRFGYSPLIASINEASLFYIIAISFTYYFYFAKRNLSNWQRFIPMGVISAGGLILGTKTVYLFFIFLVLFHWVNNRRQVIPVLLVLGGIVTLGVLLIVPFFSDNYCKLGILDSISSLRYTLLTTKVVPLISNYWSWYNFLIGGNNNWQHFVEMDNIDLFTLSGVIGTCVMFILWFKSLFYYKFINGFILFFAFSFFCLANMSGHFMWSGVNGLYLAMFMLLLQKHKEKEHQYKD